MEDKQAVGNYHYCRGCEKYVGGWECLLFGAGSEGIPDEDG